MTFANRDRWQQLVADAQEIAVLTGAGISTAAGIPDYRSPGGLWERYNPQQVMSLTGLQNDPQGFWRFWREHYQNLHQRHQPTAAHRFWAQLEHTKPVTIITQNVDGLHQAAGSQQVLPLHGSVDLPPRCFAGHHQLQWQDAVGDVPTCPHCGALVKPDVVLFQQQLDPLLFQQARDAIKRSDLLVIVGSSMQVQPVANLPKKVTHHPHKQLVVINAQPTPYDRFAALVVRDDIEQFFAAMPDPSAE